MSSILELDLSSHVFFCYLEIAMLWRRLVLELVLVCWAGSQVALAGVAAPRTASRRRIPRSHADRKFRSGQSQYFVVMNYTLPLY